MTDLAGGGPGGSHQLKDCVASRLEQVRHPHAVAEDAVGPLGVPLDDVVVHAVEQGDDGVVGVGPLDLVGVPLVKAELAVS